MLCAEAEPPAGDVVVVLIKLSHIPLHFVSGIQTPEIWAFADCSLSTSQVAAHALTADASAAMQITQEYVVQCLRY